MRPLGHPVTGGVKTPITPTLGLGQDFAATGVKTTMPAFIGLTVCLITPLPLDGFFVRRMVEPLTRTLTPAFALPCELTRSVSVLARPTVSCFGETATAVQNTTGGTNGPLTVTLADAELFAVLVSCSAATVVPVFVIVPVVFAVVTRVIVTEAPTLRLPSWQLTSVPPVHVPCDVATETKVIPDGTGSASVTPVALFGPLFVTTIDHVTWLPVVTGFGLADLVICRSTFGAGGGGGGGGGGAALVFVSVQVAVCPAASVIDPFAAQPSVLVRLYPETELSLTV